MKKDKTKSVKCKRCGFVFTVENKPVVAWMDDYAGCIIGRPDYCDSLKDKKNDNRTR